MQLEEWDWGAGRRGRCACEKCFGQIVGCPKSQYCSIELEGYPRSGPFVYHSDGINGLQTQHTSNKTDLYVANGGGGYKYPLADPVLVQLYLR